ncbi:SH3 domain-containing protein [Streptomyces sp. ACT015]|uniref:SH3 domain-containing protein n=1 Tax=Streptomyces sp. ACT015 TaxID=3134807 RepID=UPI003D16B581
MSLRSSLTRLAIATAAGVLVASAAAAPALADDGWDGDGGGHSRHDGGGDANRPHRTWGRVTASELLLRSRPDRHSEVIRVAHRGERVPIDCQTKGQYVEGTRLWYLLTDGTWAWGSARYIDTERTPRWC